MLTSLLSDNAVSEVVTVAVKIDMMTNPIRTQMKANTLAIKDLGARSPYLGRSEKIIFNGEGHRRGSPNGVRFAKKRDMTLAVTRDACRGTTNCHGPRLFQIP